VIQPSDPRVAGVLRAAGLTPATVPSFTTTSVISSDASSIYGDAVTFTATVTATSGTGTPTGTVQFFVDGSAFGSPVALVGGSATSDALTALSAGDHTVYAVYSNSDGGFFSSSSASIMQNVAQREVTVTADPQFKVYGQADPALAYQVTSGSLANGDSFSGNLSRAEGENAGSYAIGQGTLALDSNYVLIFEGADLTIAAAGTTTDVVASSNPVNVGDPVTFTATVSAVAPGAGTPVGSVQFQVDGVNFGDPVALVDGSASLTTSSLSAGTHTITAVYLSSDGNFTNSTGSLPGIEVIEASPLSFVAIAGVTADGGTVGTPITFKITIAGADPTHTFLYLIDWDGNGAPDDAVGGQPASFTVNHTYFVVGSYWPGVLVMNEMTFETYFVYLNEELTIS
jgi:hypothetical protein